MKLNGSMLFVVAMMVGSLGALGCKSNDASTDPAGGSDTSAAAVAPEETPDTVSTATAAAPGVEKDERAFHFYAPHAPPALRIEERGALRPGHFWAPGYYRWNGHEHVWANGGWYAERPGYSWVAPRWAAEGPRWRYYRGYWRR